MGIMVHSLLWVTQEVHQFFLLDGPPGGSMGFGLSGDFTSYITTIGKAARRAVLL